MLKSIRIKVIYCVMFSADFAIDNLHIGAQIFFKWNMLF